MGEGVKYPAPTPTLKDAADQVEVRKAFSDLSRVLEKKIVGEKTGSDPARGLYVENTEGPNAQEIAAPGTIPIRDNSGALPGSITGDAHTVDGAHASVTPSAGEIPILDGAGAAAIDITGNAPTATLATNATNADTVATANEAADTTCFPLFVPDATGDQEPKTNANLTFNAATGVLGALGLLLTAGGTVGNFYAGVLNANVLSSSNANQFMDRVSVYFVRIMDIVFVIASMRFRSATGTGTQAGNIRLTPPAYLAIGAATLTTLSPGHVWRASPSITSDNEWVKYVSASSRIDTNGTLDSTEAGIEYGGIWAYTMAAS
jgi:hypothetical protein